jgi:FtsH-binding integral membrane protein
MGQYAFTIVIAALLLVFIIYQQVRTRSINPRQLVVLPVFLAILGIVNLDKHPPASASAGTLLAASVITALVFGAARGITTEVWWSPDREQLRKGTTVTLLLWIAAIALRIVIAIIGHREGVPTNVSTGEIPLFLGITLAAQNLVIWQRAQATSMPGAVAG